MSDLHIGASDTDESRIEKELQYAVENDCLVLINGDWGEFIVHQDRKRYTPGVPTADIAASSSQVDRNVEKAAKLLAPYASRIAMIGSGNHETAIQKHHGVDVTRHLIDKLNGRPSGKGFPPITHGGYTGGVVLSFQREGADRPSGCHQFKIWYHHGFGGSAPITKGMVDYSRVGTFVEDADLMWMGHKHQRWANPTTVCRFPRDGKDFKYNTQWHLFTSHYKKYGETQFDSSGRYKPDWNRERGAAPSPSGGAFLWLCPHDHGIKSKIVMEE